MDTERSPGARGGSGSSSSTANDDNNNNRRKRKKKKKTSKNKSKTKQGKTLGRISELVEEHDFDFGPRSPLPASAATPMAHVDTPRNIGSSPRGEVHGVLHDRDDYLPEPRSLLEPVEEAKKMENLDPRTPPSAKRLPARIGNLRILAHVVGLGRGKGREGKREVGQ